MKAVQITNYGTSDVLNFQKNAAMPAVSPGNVLIEVCAAGVNPIDWKIQAGDLQNRLKLNFPAILGVDFSGVIVDVGAGVTDFKKGDEVYGMSSFYATGSGSFADLVIANPKNIALKPKKLTHLEAAALPLAGISALQALSEIINLTEGKKVLIHGGSGGVGSMAIQLAKNMGAYVATTVRGKNKKFVEKLGADEVIDFEKQAFEDILHDYDAVLDTVGGDTFIKSFKVIKNGGMIVSLLTAPRKEDADKYGAMLAHLRKETGENPKVTATLLVTGVTSDRLAKLAKLADEGRFKVYIDKTFPLEKGKEALIYQKDKHPIGKIAIEVKSKGDIAKLLNKFSQRVKEK